MTGTWVDFHYWGFYDVPRLIDFSFQGKHYVLDSPFSDELDEYEDYAVFEVQGTYDRATWADDPNAIQATRLGKVPVGDVRFDSTRRRCLDVESIDCLPLKDYLCPCCGARIIEDLDAPPNTDFCSQCEWEIRSDGIERPDDVVPPNEISLNEARRIVSERGVEAVKLTNLAEFLPGGLVGVTIAFASDWYDGWLSGVAIHEGHHYWFAVDPDHDFSLGSWRRKLYLYQITEPELEEERRLHGLLEAVEGKPVEQWPEELRKRESVLHSPSKYASRESLGWFVASGDSRPEAL